MDEVGVSHWKGQVFLLQLMFYLLCPETEPDRGTVIHHRFFYFFSARYHSRKKTLPTPRWRDVCGGWSLLASPHPMTPEEKKKRTSFLFLPSSPCTLSTSVRGAVTFLSHVLHQQRQFFFFFRFFFFFTQVFSGTFDVLKVRIGEGEVFYGLSQPSGNVVVCTCYTRERRC